VSFSAQGTFYADRFRSDTNSNDSIVITKYDIPSAGETSLPIGFTSAIKFAWTAGSTGSLNDFRQRVEDPKRFMGQTITLSYYIRASASCTVNNRRIGFSGVTNGPATSNLPNLSVTTTWQRVVDTVTLNTTTNAVFSASSFLDVVLSNPYRTTVDVYITGVQLEVGPVATPFEHRSYGQELALCERYCTVYNTNGEMKIPITSATTDVANRPEVMLMYPRKRTAPAITVVNPTNFNIYTAANTAITCTAFSGAIAGTGVLTTDLFWTVSSGVATNNLSGIIQQLSIFQNTGSITVDAEL
jgi:hypothetical protein